MDIVVPTDSGPGRLAVAVADHPAAVLWLGHGAGGGIEAVDLAALATALPALGVTVARFEQPWRTAGKRLAPRPAALDAAWLQAAPLVRELAAGLPLVVGGRSAGARRRTAESVGAAAVVCLAFPLHPPGRPDKSRLDELLAPEVPVLVLQGERDTFGTAAEVAGAVGSADGRADIAVVGVPDADHSLKTPARSPVRAADVADVLTVSVADFIRHVTRA
ncbi:alpha/beta family hydrolase [Leifsonia sp. NPDC058292]|uniref:alpha/beta hydrolase family protein n=1 Tax=Leifsonia sp. NPDC058292 TaxID=3346428 RepID=UPI0036DCE682